MTNPIQIRHSRPHLDFLVVFLANSETVKLMHQYPLLVVWGCSPDAYFSGACDPSLSLELPAAALVFSLFTLTYRLKSRGTAQLCPMTNFTTTPTR